MKVGDLDIFYREAGAKDAPAVLLLHGFPTSSQMFRNLIPALAADRWRERGSGGRYDNFPALSFHRLHKRWTTPVRERIWSAVAPNGLAAGTMTLR